MTYPTNQADPRTGDGDTGPAVADPGEAGPAGDAGPGEAVADHTTDGGVDDPAGVPEADGEDTDQVAEVDWEHRVARDGRSRGDLLAALVAAEADRDERLDQLRRKQAEFDNFRKRMARDAQVQRIAGKEAMALALLDVLDDFDRTITALEGDEASRRGVELVRDKLVDALAAQGLHRIEAQGAEFDPNLHEAVQQVPGDGGEPTVTEVFRSGWKMHDRVLRAAMVVVSQ